MIIEMAPWQILGMRSPYEHFAMLTGIACGKTYTGSHFAIDNFIQHPDLFGFIGANNYDQLSQVTLKELFYWLQEYGWEFVIDRRPPPEWKSPYRFKDWNNILTVKNPKTKAISHAYTRVLAKGNSLRGLEFSWYWIDETRDTPLNTHDVILGRMRESGYRKGLVTTTTNAEDWVYHRFVKNNKQGSKLYGSIHVPTSMSVKYGIITQEYYDMLRASYSPMMAMQELDAKHVNVLTGRAYYSSGEHNRKTVAPWGDRYPDINKPLIIGCDFNFFPAPCVWMVGQLGVLPDGRTGIHWFNEISETQISTEDMTKRVLNQFPGFFYQFFGDASGTKGTTSNQGFTDTVQITTTLLNAGALYTLDFEQSNPIVKDRVENMNRLFQNGMGQVTQTYDPINCPLFDSDCKGVGWRVSDAQVNKKGKLDDGGDKKRTHATDGAGYAIFKLFPPLAIGQSGGGSIRSKFAGE